MHGSADLAPCTPLPFSQPTTSCGILSMDHPKSPCCPHNPSLNWSRRRPDSPRIPLSPGPFFQDTPPFFSQLGVARFRPSFHSPFRLHHATNPLCPASTPPSSHPDEPQLEGRYHPFLGSLRYPQNQLCRLCHYSTSQRRTFAKPCLYPQFDENGRSQKLTECSIQSPPSAAPSSDWL